MTNDPDVGVMLDRLPARSRENRTFTGCGEARFPLSTPGGSRPTRRRRFLHGMRTHPTGRCYCGSALLTQLASDLAPRPPRLTGVFYFRGDADTRNAIGYRRWNPECRVDHGSQAHHTALILYPTSPESSTKIFSGSARNRTESGIRGVASRPAVDFPPLCTQPHGSLRATSQPYLVVRAPFTLRNQSAPHQHRERVSGCRLSWLGCCAGARPTNSNGAYRHLSLVTSSQRRRSPRV